MASRKETVLSLVEGKSFSDEFELVDFIATEGKKILKRKIKERDIVEILIDNNKWQYEIQKLPDSFTSSEHLNKYIIKNCCLFNKEDEKVEECIDLIIEKTAFDWMYAKEESPEYKIMYDPSMESKFLTKQLNREKPHQIRDWYPYVPKEDLHLNPSIEYFLEIVKECNYLSDSKKREIESFCNDFNNFEDLKSHCRGISREFRKIQLEKESAEIEKELEKESAENKKQLEKEMKKANRPRIGEGFSLVYDLAKLLIVLIFVFLLLKGCFNAITGDYSDSTSDGYMKRCRDNGTSQSKCEEQYEYIKTH